MSARRALLVGSMPFEDEEASMRRALGALGPSLLCLPDGEIGERSAAFPRGDRISWVIYAVEAMTRDTSRWRVVKQATRGDDGMAVDYDSIQKLVPLLPPAEMSQRVRFGYERWFRRSYPTFQRLRVEAGRPELRFQLGVPTGFATGFAFASKLDWLRYTGAMSAVIAREVNTALEEAGDDVIVQIELPPELYAAHHLPAPLLGLALWPVRDFLARIRPGAQIGVHLCLGDFRNEALLRPRTLDRMVSFSNRLVAGWPEEHRLVYIHYPLAEGSVPPTLAAHHYRPLQGARLPAGARFVAGFVHEGRTLEENRRILGAIEDARGERVAVACSCGLGRRPPGIAERLLALMAELVEA